jgi:hypothetical protein
MTSSSDALGPSIGLSPVANDHKTSWLNYSQLDQHKFSLNLALFSLTSSLFTQPLNVLTTRQQASHLTIEHHEMRTSGKDSKIFSFNVVNDLLKSARAIGKVKCKII